MQNKKHAFTLIELVLVILVLGILAAIAIPNFTDFRSDARNASTQGGLGAIRSAVSVARAAIALKEDSSTPNYPAIAEMQTNAFQAASHPKLAAAGEKIMDNTSGFPVNPWSLSTIPVGQQSSIYDCGTMSLGAVRTTASQIDHGWCYKGSTGNFWANSDRNGSAGTTENSY